MSHPIRPVVLDQQGRQIARLRKLCFALPGVNEKLAWGTPCFYAGKKIFAMFSDDHHGDGRLAVWLKAPPGMQQLLLETSPEQVFKPPYVGPYGWIGLHLKLIDDSALAHHARAAWRLAATKTLLKQLDAPRID
ncbi:MAG: MmcQ/YjbR family DNA-binding protein [Pseudomonadota bacterium]